MAVALSPIGGAGAQFFDNNGNPLVGGKIYTYEAGTTTPAATYTTLAGTTAHTNPIILDSAGRVPGGEIWLTLPDLYKFVIKTSADVTIGTYDNIQGYSSGSISYAATEVQTATAGQTLFVLTEMFYNPGTNTLAVFIDGVNQVVNNSYVESTSTSVTFMSGLHVGAVVKFVNLNVASTDATTVTYEPGFVGSVATTVAAKLQQTVSVKDFGAVGDGVTDDTASVQAFFDYIAANNVGTAYCDGKFLLSSGVYYGNGVTQAATLQIVGYAEFIASTAIDIMVDFRSASNFVWDGGVRVIGTGGTSYASRTCRVGIRIGGTADSARMKFGVLRANFFYDTGISGYSLTNSTLTDLGNVRAGYCGSGKTGFSLTANWSNPVNSGSSNSTGQSTVIDVDVLPPAVLEHKTLVNINGQPYYVKSVDTVNSTLTVFPWVDSTLTSGSLIYMFGGGVQLQGSDTNVYAANQIDATGCGFALWTSALYGPIVNRLVAQSCGAGFAYGREVSASNVGFTLNGYYAEQNEFDLVKVTGSFNNGGTNIHGGVIITDYENKYAKWASCAAARSSTNVLSASGVSSNTVNVISAGTMQQYVAQGSNGQETSSSYSLFPTDAPKNLIFRRDNWTVNVQAPDDDRNRLFGYGFDTLTIIGIANTNGNPTGTFTFNAPSGYTVNGGASVAFSGFTGPAVFQIYYLVSTLDILIRCTTHSPSGSATYNPPSLNDGDGATTTVAVTGAELGDYAEASFSNDLQGITMTAWVSAADTVSVRFQNETGGVLDLASGTLRARVKKAV